jgi:UDP-N-acetylmuramoyl-tripeptide--D-alanyl-D-alanine ligase
MFTIEEIIQATGGRLLTGATNGRIRGVSIDSRTIKVRQLFIAIKGDQFDGHDFVEKLEQEGHRFFLVHKTVKTNLPQTTVILVKDTTKALGHLAGFHRNRFDIPVIAITGSAGKTTTKEMIAAVLRKNLNVLANKGTLNNHIGVPLTLLKLTNRNKAAVIEMGTNQPGDIPWLATIAQPTMAVLTNIGESHLEKLKTLKGVYDEKITLARAIPAGGFIIFNADDEHLRRIADEKLTGRLVPFSVQAKTKNQAYQVRIDPSTGLHFKIHKKPYFLKTFSVSMTYNALAAIVCANLLKVTFSHLKAELSRFRFSAGRQEVLRKNGMVVINDTYNANPVSMRSAIAMLDCFPSKGRRILICADMMELGQKSKLLHAQVGEFVAGSRIDVLMTLGEQARWTLERAHAVRPHLVVFHFTDMEKLKNYASVLLQNGDVALVKGSRRMKMENIVRHLTRDIKE